MAMTEERRHELYEAMKEQLGMGPATTLMEAMPPVGWADVMTKRDADAFEERMGLRMDNLEARRRADVSGQIIDLQRNLFLGMLAAQTAFAGVVIAAVRFLIV